MSDTQYELDADRLSDECEYCGKLNAFCKCDADECPDCAGSTPHGIECHMCGGNWNTAKLLRGIE